MKGRFKKKKSPDELISGSETFRFFVFFFFLSYLILAASFWQKAIKLARFLFILPLGNVLVCATCVVIKQLMLTEKSLFTFYLLIICVYLFWQKKPS